MAQSADMAVMTDPSLTRMAQLEKSFDDRLKTLSTIRSQLTIHESRDTSQWLKEIAEVRKLSEKSKVIIGIVGATGAGKSVLVNALLDEETISPVSCVKACTAVVTEIAYNYSSVPYRAEVEFISRVDWHTELEALLGDLIDSQGKVSKDSYNQDAEAGIAYAKLKAVYPDLTKDQIAKSSVNQLMSHQSVDRLGAVHILEHDNAESLHESLKKYVESGGKKDHRLRADQEPTQEFEYWPLIRVVRIFVKAAVLESGATLVDLPGIHDSNAARASIAKNYLKECSSLLVVADINRAVSDKAAKTLMGEAFKQQLRLDGAISQVTFVCSKTDHIDILEAHNAFDLGPQVADHYARLEAMQGPAERLPQERERVQHDLNVARVTSTNVKNELDVYEGLRQSAERGVTVYKPEQSDHSTKRKMATLATTARKRQLRYIIGQSEEVEDVSGCEILPPSSSITPMSGSRSTLTLEQVNAKIDQLRIDQQTIHAKCSDLIKQHSDCLDELAEIKRESKEIHACIFKTSVEARNDYVCAAIKNDFAAGIKELDQDFAMEADPDGFNPEVDLRDYEAVAHSLPVFCVSSRGYQELQGRFRMNDSTKLFRHIDETQIPALRNHCRAIPDRLRISAHESFVSSFDQLCNSLRIWAVGDDDDAKDLTRIELKEARTRLNTQLDAVSNVLLGIATTIMNNIAISIQRNIYDVFPDAIHQAQSKAVATCEAWGAPDGLKWRTYQATVRRCGLFMKPTIVHDFNADLVLPVKKKLAHGWEKVFIRLVPITFAEHTADFSRHLAEFNQLALATAKQYGASPAIMYLLEQQASAYNRKLEKAANTARSQLKTGQKASNREFATTILTDMQATYAECASKHGKGMFLKMKQQMKAGVDISKEDMFDRSLNHIRGLLDNMMADVTQDFSAEVLNVIQGIKRDYVQLFDSQDQNRVEKEMRLRSRVLCTINEAYVQEVSAGAQQDVLLPEKQDKDSVIKSEFGSRDDNGDSKVKPGSSDSVAQSLQLPLRSATPLSAYSQFAANGLNIN